MSACFRFHASRAGRKNYAAAPEQSGKDIPAAVIYQAQKPLPDFFSHFNGPFTGKATVCSMLNAYF